MGAPSVNYRLLADGYKVSAGENGFRATASFLVDWADAFTFVDDVMGSASAAVVGPVTYSDPWRFPGAPNARLYCAAADVEPIGMDGSPLPPNMGLAPGEFWTHAKISVVWETPAYPQSPTDDPGGNATQLDPANPLTYCEQSIRSGGTMETQKKGGYEWDPGETADLTAIKQDLAMYVPESRLVLSFPRLPFLPWTRVQEYLGSLNDRTIFRCAAETLLFEDSDTKVTATSQGLMGQSFQMTLAYNKHGWNRQFNEAEGDYIRVRRKGNTSKSIYEVMDWRPMFA